MALPRRQPPGGDRAIRAGGPVRASPVVAQQRRCQGGFTRVVRAAQCLDRLSCEVRAMKSRWFTLLCMSVIAWGTFSLGAIYPWGYLPLLGGCATLGLLALVFSPRQEVLNSARLLMMGLVALI